MLEDDQDFQISYNDVISVIHRLFNDKIKECAENYPDAGFIEALKEMREEFADDFRMTLEQVIHQKI